MNLNITQMRGPKTFDVWRCTMRHGPEGKTEDCAAESTDARFGKWVIRIGIPVWTEKQQALIGLNKP